MSLIFTSKKSLKNKAIIAINGNKVIDSVETKGDITLIFSKSEVVGININNYSNHFSAKEGLHSLTNEQIDFFKSNNISFEFGSNIMFSTILKVRDHSKLKRLKIIKANVDKEREFITNIDTLEAGDRILVALTGTTLIDGSVIKSGKIAGVQSDVAIVTGNSLGITLPNISESTSKDGTSFSF